MRKQLFWRGNRHPLFSDSHIFRVDRSTVPGLRRPERAFAHSSNLQFGSQLRQVLSFCPPAGTLLALPPGLPVRWPTSTWMSPPPLDSITFLALLAPKKSNGWLPFGNASLTGSPLSLRVPASSHFILVSYLKLVLSALLLQQHTDSISHTSHTSTQIIPLLFLLWLRRHRLQG